MLLTSLALIVVCLAVLGLGIGSFLNVVILRTHRQQPLTGRSACPQCHKQLRWYELLPVLSFALQAGRCRHCHKTISWQYPLVELITAATFVLLAVVFSAEPIRLAIYCVYAAGLILIFAYDAKYYLIPDQFTVPLFVFATLASMYLGLNWLNLVIGIVIGGGLFLGQYVVSRGHWIGGGDIRLGAVMGAMLGWPNILVALFLAYMFGAAVAVGLILVRRKRMTDQLPFGTFLSIATVVSLISANDIVTWYVHTILKF